jgi:beta-glucosidase
MMHSASLAWLALATTTYAQFGIDHSQYGTSPPVYPSRKYNAGAPVVCYCAY